jgi:uncharacterized membrane protein YhaH (DUF805 family)
MHDSSVMPFIHVGVVAIVLLAIVVTVIVRRIGDRRRRGKPFDASEEAELDHG